MTILIILVVLLLLYVFIVAPRMINRADRTPFYGRHYAHRGLFDNDSEAPENSLAAFKKAVEADYNTWSCCTSCDEFFSFTGRSCRKQTFS